MVRGARRSLSIALLVGASGCSVLYDPDRLQDRADAAVDGRSLDAEPLNLTGIETGLLEEGAGLGGSRPAVVRVLGTGMTNATMFRASWQGSGEPLEIVEREVSADGRAAALAFAVEVDPTLSSGARTLVIGLGDNSASETVQAEVAMLPELTTQAPAAPFEYSMIHITNATHIPGAIGPLVLRSASSITLDARYDVDAGDDLGGRGACVEGPSCPGGGKPGTGGFGGGGGGFGGAGGQGQGFGQGGAGGPAVGDPMMIPFGAGPNRGHLGGVGFDGNGGDAQPGGGGGALALWSEGDVTIGPVGALSAAGGAGKPGLRVPSGGGGGGGSGGAVMIHAGGTLHARAGSIDCPGGAGGRDQYDGGDGGQGRVRIDAGMLEGIAGPLVDDLVGGGVPYRGPAFARETPLVTSTATTDLQALGPPQTMMALTAPGGVRSAMTDAAGSVRFLDVPTPSGVHRLCVTVAGAADDPLGRACLYLAAP